MAKLLIAYYSKSGNTEQMAQHVKQGAEMEKTAEVTLKKIADVTVSELTSYDGIIIGSPVYYGSMAGEIKKLFDESVKFHGKLEGKVGGAFASSMNIGGGNETTILDILHSMLIHGMIIQGSPGGDHYGPVAIGAPNERSKGQCINFGRRIAILTKATSNNKELKNLCCSA